MRDMQEYSTKTTGILISCSDVGNITLSERLRFHMGESSRATYQVITHLNLFFLIYKGGD